MSSTYILRLIVKLFSAFTYRTGQKDFSQSSEHMQTCIVLKLRHNRQNRSPDHRVVIGGSNPAKIRRPSADLAPILDSSGGDPANLKLRHTRAKSIAGSPCGDRGLESCKNPAAIRRFGTHPGLIRR